jgi:hypothetical protein
VSAPRDELAEALAEAGGTSAAAEANARLRGLLAERLADGAAELARPRSGYDLPVGVGIAATGDALVAVAPVDAALRADPARASERGWLLAAALVGALVEAGETGEGQTLTLGGTTGEGQTLTLLAGEFGEGRLALSLPARGADAELAAIAFDAAVEPVDRLRAVAFALPSHVLDAVRDLRPPVGDRHQLRVAEAVARLGGNPADPRSFEDLEEAVIARLGARREVTRPHDDPVPARRVARRILQRMAGMGKWGGYHTAFDHLARGFEGNDRRLAQDVGERLLAAGLLAEKPSVGQRHVFLNPRRAPEIYALVDDGVVPDGLDLG